MIRILFGFIVGVFYGVIVAVDVPDGALAKAGQIFKMIFFS